MKRYALPSRRGLAALGALTGTLLTTPSFSQPPPAAPPPAGVAAPRPPPVAPLPDKPAPPSASMPSIPSIAPPPAAPDQLAAALSPQAGGLTADEASKIAAKTKHSVRAKQADLAAAAAKVDQALVSYFPRISLTASYTRLSPVSGFSLGGGALVGVQNAGLLGLGPCATDATKTCPVDAKGKPVGASAVSFPAILNAYSFVASIAVPISDYVLRVSQGYAVATHAEKGKRLELEAETLQVASDAKLTFFNWVRTRGQVVVARQAVDQSKAHVGDANKAFSLGFVSRADVLRLEAQVAAAQQVQAEADAFAAIAEEQLRILLSLPAERSLSIGADVLHEQASPPTETLQALQDQAMQRRLEIRALDETELSLKETVNLARAGYLPRLDAFADATYANPNQRVFPSQDRFDLTWDAGVRLSWTLNDTITALGTTAEAKARVASVAEQKGALRDGLRLEVASAYTEVQKAAVTIEAADRQLVAAEESLRVRNELFRNGKATSVDLIDAETEVTRGRLGRLNARVGLLVARVRLDHATGRDVPPRPTE